MQFRSIGIKIGLLLIASIMIFVAITGYVSYRISASALKSQISEAYRGTAVQTSEKLDFLYGAFEKMMMQMMVDADLQRTVSGIQETKDEGVIADLSNDLDTKLQSYMYADSAITSVEVLTTGGQLIPTTSGLLTNKDYSTEAWFKSVLASDGHTVWLGSNLADNRNTNPTVTVARVIHGQGQSQGYCVIVIDLSLDVIAKQMLHVQMGSGSVQVVDASGIIVYAADPAKRGQRTNYSLPAPSNQTNAGTSSGSFRLDNSEGQIVYAASPVNGWYTVGLIPIRDLIRDADKIQTATLYVLLAALLAALVIGYMAARSIGKPLGRIRDRMAEGAKGNLRVRIGGRRRDEIGQLAVSFDQMMDKLTVLMRDAGHSAREVAGTAGALALASSATGTAAQEVSYATTEIARGGEGLAAEAEQGMTLTQEVLKQTQSLVEASRDMESAAGLARESCEEGTQSMQEVLAKTAQAEEAVRALSGKIKELGDSASSIRKMISMLAQLTQQTNILSLNATIEASRAGAAGKGFAVVADEIRRLAEQSKQSIKSVGRIADTVEGDIVATVSLLASAEPLFGEQAGAIRASDRLFTQVGDHTSGFIGRLEEVNGAIKRLEAFQNVLSHTMTNVSAVSEASLATSQEVASLTQEQLKVSDDLTQHAERLRQLSDALNTALSRFEWESGKPEQ